MASVPLLVGIAGPSSSGKSTLEAGLRNRFEDSISFVSFDDFFVGLSALPGRTTDNWDHPDLYRWDEYERVLADLKDGKTARFVPHSYEAKRDGVTERVLEPSPIVVATGFLALYSPAVNALFDRRVYIDLPPEEMVRRRLARSAERPSGVWNDPDYINRTLVASTREFVEPQQEEAHFVINGMCTPGHILSMVATIIDSLRLWSYDDRVDRAGNA